MSKYRRITYEDRCQIYALNKRGASQESIAEVFGVSQSAASRDICCTRGQRSYQFKQAELKAQARQAIRSKALGEDDVITALEAFDQAGLEHNAAIACAVGRRSFPILEMPSASDLIRRRIDNSKLGLLQARRDSNF